MILSLKRMYSGVKTQFSSRNPSDWSPQEAAAQPLRPLRLLLAGFRSLPTAEGNFFKVVVEPHRPSTLRENVIYSTIAALKDPRQLHVGAGALGHDQLVRLDAPFWHLCRAGLVT